MPEQEQFPDHTMYPSAHAIGDEVTFRPMFRHQQKMGIADENMEGQIVAIRFTAAKVFYDVFSPYWASIFDEVDSIKVWKENHDPLPIDANLPLN